MFVESCHMAQEDVQQLRRSELCPPVQKLYQTSVYHAACGSVLEHLHSVWALLAAAGMLLVMVLTFAAFVDLERCDVEIDDDTPTARARRRRQLKAAARRRKKRALAAVTADASAVAPADGEDEADDAEDESSRSKDTDGLLADDAV
jgi:hypothetical protein